MVLLFGICEKTLFFSCGLSILQGANHPLSGTAYPELTLTSMGTENG